MAAVEKVLAHNPALRNDPLRTALKVPFAPFLASHLETRISDLAAPRSVEPANTDRFERSRDDRADRRTERDPLQVNESKHAARKTPRRSDAPDRRDAVEGAARPDGAIPSGSDKPAPAATEHSEIQPQSDKPENNPADAKNEGGEIASDSEQPQKVSETTSDSAPVDPVTAETVASATSTTVVSVDPETITASVTADLNSGAAVAAIAVPASTPAAPALSTPAPVLDTVPHATAPSTPSSQPEHAGKIQIPGLAPSNDDAPSKIGSDVPQVVRDVQNIVARPANATGVNLLHAQQQGEPPVTPSPNPPAQNALGQNSQAQNTPAQNVPAQPGNTPAPTPNTGTQGAGTQIAGAAANPAAAQPAAQDFQSNITRVSASVGGAGAAPGLSGDGASALRSDAPMSGAASGLGTVSADPASRAASASAPAHPHRTAATDQVSVNLKKAVENGDSKIRIQLRPHELGKVEVKLDIAGDGRVKALVLAERPETLDLLQRDSRVLERALQDAGLKTDHNSLSFDLQGRDGDDRTRQAQKDGPDGASKANERASAGDDDSDMTEAPIPATAIGLAPNGSVNFLA